MNALIARVGISGIAILLLALALAVQTARLEGFKVWPLDVEGANPRGERLQRELAAVELAMGKAKLEQEAAMAAAERAYSDLTKRIDDHAENEIADHLRDADRFIAANRVRCPRPGNSLDRANPAPADTSAGDGQEAGRAAELDEAGDMVPAGHVIVPEQDVRICTINTLQAEAAHEWALDLEAASKAQR